MATKFEKPLEASQVTPVADMPPLEVVTEGIPAQEHLEALQRWSWRPPLCRRSHVGVRWRGRWPE